MISHNQQHEAKITKVSYLKQRQAKIATKKTNHKSKANQQQQDKMSNGTPQIATSAALQAKSSLTGAVASSNRSLTVPAANHSNKVLQQRQATKTAMKSNKVQWQATKNKSKQPRQVRNSNDSSKSATARHK